MSPTCVLLNKLIPELPGIEIEPISNGFVDSLAYRCTLTQKDGSIRSAVGIANLNEMLDDKRLTVPQLHQMASGRAIRNALRVAGIDLLKLHNQSKGGVVQFSGPALSNYEKLLREAHVLGYETSLIFSNEGVDGHGEITKFLDKSGWQRVLKTRYYKTKSSDLEEFQLADFVAFLRSQMPAKAAA